ncbi:Homeodomain-like superfamily protein isoform 2 [Hibiscus syriacus]|uniref:Homeodomain-like superfamily protein isoform 2 n=1 Tax=Hibiscus syriacus TaxID=106335 RepID=A0A6A2WAP2_HIBSY|nr:Homeodomain-like superfamily protein isoform 2 [Hibiscus syriacus]
MQFSSTNNYDENTNTKKQKKGSIRGRYLYSLQRYTATTVLALLQEVAQFPDAKLDWNALVKKTSTGISNAREYQMAKVVVDDDSDLEYELEPYSSVSSETSAEAAAYVKVLIASGLPNDSSGANSSMVDAPLTIIYLMFCLQCHRPKHWKEMDQLVQTCLIAGKENLGQKKDLELIAAVQKCGTGNWANILRGDFKGDRSANQLAQRWSVIKKRFGNLNVEGHSVISEAQLATRNALSIALPMADKNLTGACSINPGLKTASGSAPPTASGKASVRTENQFQQGLLASVSSHNRPQYGPITSVPSQNPSGQGPVASVQVPNQSRQGLVSTQSSSSGSALKSRVTLKRVPAKAFSTTGLILDATAVAAGARIGSPKAAASLLKAAQSKNAIHIMTSGGSSIKPLIPSGTSSQYFCTGLTAEPHSSPVTSSTLQPGSVKPATQRVGHTSSVSSSPLNDPIQQCNVVTSGPTIEGPLKEELDAAMEISVSDSSPKGQVRKGQVRENRACVPKNEQGEGVKDHKEAVPNPKSKLNLEAVAGHSNKKLMVKVSQPTAEERCGNQNIIETPAKANLLNDDCTKSLEVLSTPETDQAT